MYSSTRVHFLTFLHADVPAFRKFVWTLDDGLEIPPSIVLYTLKVNDLQLDIMQLG